VFRFYHALGVNLKQIYGQTEIIGIAYAHRDGDVRFDTVGKPLPGTELRISPEGEILSRSDAVCAGYYKRPEDTAALLEGGWLRSGDAGYVTEDGHLVVIDRVSDVMRTRAGEVFSPQYVENKLKFSPYIKEAVAYGDGREYIAALVNVDPATVGHWAESRGLAYTTYMDLSRKPEGGRARPGRGRGRERHPSGGPAGAPLRPPLQAPRRRRRGAHPHRQGPAAPGG
jgi:long-chain acyl-CoA synthetase